jgi:hypothetical protein
VNYSEGFKETISFHHPVLLPQPGISFELTIFIESIMPLVQRNINTVDCLDKSSENFTSVKALWVKPNLPFLRSLKGHNLLSRMDDSL